MKSYNASACLIVGMLSVQSMANVGSNDVSQINQALPLEKTPDILPIPNVEVQVESNQTSKLNLGQGMVRDINQAIVTKNWQTLEELLKDYPSSNEYDVLLYQYALGAWYRSRLKHAQAIKVYQQMLMDNPDFHYVRFDLAIMLYENKQYDEAQAELIRVKSFLNTHMQGLVERYLEQIRQRKKADFDFHINYEKNDNVNNASSATHVQWGGRTWQKSAESLPQKATGVRYGMGVSKDIALQGNHYLNTNMDFRGVHYWDNPRYDEQTVSLGVGYKYQNINSHFSLSPFIDYTWFDDELYQREMGIKANFNRRINTRLNVGMGVQYFERYYDNERLAKLYDSHVNLINVGYRYALAPRILVFGGADVTNDNTKDKEQASVRYGLNMGILGEMDSGLGARVSVRYVKRNFEVPEQLLYGFTRRDDEYYLQTSWWHNKLHYKGFMPNLNISYRKVDSNMDDLYSRDGVQSFISIEKKF